MSDLSRGGGGRAARNTDVSDTTKDLALYYVMSMIAAGLLSPGVKINVNPELNMSCRCGVTMIHEMNQHL